MTDTALLSWIIFLPAVGAVALLFLRGDSLIKWTTLLVTLATCILTFVLMGRFLGLMKVNGGTAPPLAQRAKESLKEIGPNALPPNTSDLVVRLPWIKSESFEIQYYLGVDGISLSLLVLTGVISLLSMLAAFSIEKQVKGFCILYLILVTGMMGIFLALDFFLFFVFFEVMLLPMYFLIGIWGGARREYAAIKFFLYTAFGSVFILIPMLAFYFASQPSTFDIMALQEMGQSVAKDALFSDSFQITMFVLLFIGFAIKVPVVPFHTWLPDAHVEAPTPISMILAGVLLKIGGYGLIRIAYPICPAGAMALATPLAVIAVVSIVYGGLAAMAQTDFKKLVAYSSVSHMGYVILGLAVLPVLDKVYYSWGLSGAMFQMIAHGISSAGMFFLVGVIYERAHHRDLNRFGGLMNIMPLYGGISVVIFFAGMGLPGLCGFIGEIFTVLAGFKFSPTLGIIAAFAVVITAGYILWTVQRVFYGSSTEYAGTKEITFRELVTVIPLVLLAVLLGVYPNSLLDWMGPDVEYLAGQLTQYGTEISKTIATTAGM